MLGYWVSLPLHEGAAQVVSQVVVTSYRNNLTESAPKSKQRRAAKSVVAQHRLSRNTTKVVMCATTGWLIASR